MKKYAVIVAGGSGQRMGTDTPKQFLLLQQKPLLWHTLHAFLQAFDDIQLILVLPKKNWEEGEKICHQFSVKNKIVLIEGGITRFHSVKNGLQFVTEPSIVFVHDGVRCLVTSKLIQQCYAQALQKGSAIPAVAATDSIRLLKGEDHCVVDRRNIRIVQTPQTFQSKLILPAFEQTYDDDFTDEATVVESFGKSVLLIEGEYTNLKITRPLDMQMAEMILSARTS